MKRYQHGMFNNSLSKLIKAFVLFCLPLTSYALTFDSGSDGSDGVLDYTWATPASGVVTIIFDPSDASTFDPGNPDRRLDIDNDNVYHFESILIPVGVRVRLIASKLNWAPVYWLSQGDIVIGAAGFLSIVGATGHSETSASGGRFPAEPGPGGFPGGIGASSLNLAQPGYGPGGGGPANSDQEGAAASHSQLGSPGSGSNLGVPGDIYGSPYLLPLVGGSGGAGAGNGTVISSSSRGGGGAGGGALLLASSTSVVINGAIEASGGAGRGTDRLQGGGGSGGSIRILAPLVAGTSYQRWRSPRDVYFGWMSVAGGYTWGGSRSDNNFGGAGRIRIEAFRNEFQGRFFPDNSDAIRISGLVPTTPFLPSDQRVPGWPRVSVTSINGSSVSAEPTGSFEFPDATVDVTTELPVVFESKNIPIAAVLNIYIYGPDFEPFNVSPTYVSGDASASTWTANVAFPVGVSRAYVQATWVP